MACKSSVMHHEIELGIIIGKKGHCIPKTECMKYIAGYCLALDMTARDIQQSLKAESLPWSLAKGFDTSCPVSDFIPFESIPDINDIQLKLTVINKDSKGNEISDVRQNASCNLMLYDIPTLINFISHYFTLEYGDIILTGTPAGVSQVGIGDRLKSELFTSDYGVHVVMDNYIIAHVGEL